MSPFLKLALDLGPLGAFFIAYRLAGLMPATLTLMAATAISLIAGYIMEKKISPMPLITGVAVGVMGGLTLYLDSEMFIKVKPTLVNLLFATILLGGLATGRPMLKYLLGSALQMEDRGWRILSLRWGLFFIFLAGLNEVIWRHFPTDFWINFKVFGMLTLTFAFTLLQFPLMQRYLIEETGEEKTEEAP